jgi:hypothetical protein
MNEVSFLLALDSMMVILLAVTAVYCFKLNFQIRVLQDSKSEFSQLITKFDATTQRAQQSIEDLQNISKKVNEQLSGRLDKANFLADDLAFMIEKGSKLADKMDGRTSGRPMEKAMSAVDNRSISRERERERDRDREAEPRRSAADNFMSRISPAASNKIDESGARRQPLTASARLRSKAEQELYDAIKSGNKS